MRSLKSRLLPKRQTSQHKLYTTRQELLQESQGSNPRGSLRRSTTVAPSKMPKNDGNYLVKRLAHYSSMADALVGSHAARGQHQQTTATNISSETSKTNTKDSDLNVSDKENKTPDRNYRYVIFWVLCSGMALGISYYGCNFAPIIPLSFGTAGENPMQF